MKITAQNMKYYFNIIKIKWLESSESFPDFLVEIPKNQKKENELYLQNKSEELRQQISSYSNLPFRRNRWKMKTKGLIILSNCYQLLYISLAGSSNFFSKDYQTRIEKLLPVSFSFLQEFGKDFFFGQVFSEKKSSIKILDAIIS